MFINTLKLLKYEKVSTYYSLCLPFITCIWATGSHARILLRHSQSTMRSSWADTMALKASELSSAGFTHIRTPPFQGNGANSGGYDPRDLYIGDNTLLLLWALSKESWIWYLHLVFGYAGCG